MASVTGALYPRHHHLSGHSLAVLSQTQDAHDVDETGGEVKLAAELAGRVVEGKRVVVIVKSLTCEEQEVEVRNPRKYIRCRIQNLKDTGPLS